MAKPVLIFPAGMPRSLAYLEHALAEGRSVIGSSSLGHDPARGCYPEWVHLPYVGDAGFDEALRKAMRDFDIESIFTPNPVVWDYLNRRLADSFPGLKLVNPSPVADEMAPYRKAIQFGMTAHAQPLELAISATEKSPMSVLETASMFLHAESIPGMCDHEKMRALSEVFRSAPAGDVVEIGSWWGKSAFLLTRLTDYFDIGRLLCVDPWSNAHLAQNDEKGLLDHIEVDADEALKVFQLNLLPYAHGAVNYLRLSSVNAAAQYRHKRTITTVAFGTTTYSGHIAVLHIDGNHSYASVRSDVAAWADLIVPGGWMIVDDYRWPYGDGPRRVGDEFLFAQQEAVEAAFVMGGALFLRLA